MTTNVRAALVMVGAIVAFAINDMFVKLMSDDLPLGQITSVRGVIIVLLLWVVLPRIGMRMTRPDRMSLVRACCEVGVTYCFLSALKRMPIGDTYTLYFSAPILLTLAAVLFLGERVGPFRWAAITTGFLGVVVALGEPAAWQTGALLAILAALFSVARDLATRRVAAHVGSGTVALMTAAAVALSGLVTLPAGWQAIDAGHALFLVLAAIGAGIGYLGFIAAVRLGDISFVASFRYTAIPVTMLLGLLVWGDIPTWNMGLGAVVISASGLVLIWRERRAQQARPP